MFSSVRKVNKLRFSRYNFGKVILIQEVYETTNKWVYGSTRAAQLLFHMESDFDIPIQVVCWAWVPLDLDLCSFSLTQDLDMV